jgi:hypothetical protein
MRGAVTRAGDDTARHDITEIFMKVALNTINTTNQIYIYIYIYKARNKEMWI